MKEIINGIGTLILICIILVCAILMKSMWFSVVSGLGVAYAMYVHDDILKHMWAENWYKARKEENDQHDAEVEKCNAQVEKYNAEVEKYNTQVDNDSANEE